MGTWASGICHETSALAAAYVCGHEFPKVSVLSDGSIVRLSCSSPAVNGSFLVNTSKLVQPVTGTAVHELALLLRTYLRKESEFRPVYVHGVKDLNLPHFPLPDPIKWHEVPDGSLVIIDECQSAFLLT